MARAARPIVEELDSALDPWDAACRFADWPGLLFFDSADRGSPFGRYSYVSGGPRAGLRWNVGDGGDPFAAIAELLDQRGEAIPDLPPFQGGIAGLFGYGLGRAIERLPRPEFHEFPTPDVVLNACDWRDSPGARWRREDARCVRVHRVVLHRLTGRILPVKHQAIPRA